MSDKELKKLAKELEYLDNSDKCDDLESDAIFSKILEEIDRRMPKKVIIHQINEIESEDMLLSYAEEIAETYICEYDTKSLSEIIKDTFTPESGYCDLIYEN